MWARAPSHTGIQPHLVSAVNRQQRWTLEVFFGGSGCSCMPYFRLVHEPKQILNKQIINKKTPKKPTLALSLMPLGATSPGRAESLKPRENTLL